MYSFVVLLITGIYLTLFFDPSGSEVTYRGVISHCAGAASAIRFPTLCCPVSVYAAALSSITLGSAVNWHLAALGLFAGGFPGTTLLPRL